TIVRDVSPEQIRVTTIVARLLLPPTQIPPPTRHHQPYAFCPLTQAGADFSIWANFGAQTSARSSFFQQKFNEKP
ncbi:MAG: hypothetical protein LUD52_04230, partial [Opitutae bacterium]|nr:hypothetical protein [Opitutae bacterium]